MKFDKLQEMLAEATLLKKTNCFSLILQPQLYRVELGGKLPIFDICITGKNTRMIQLI